MPRPLSDQSKAIIEACREHLMMDGSKDWQAVRLRFPDVPKTTFFRLVEVAKQQLEGSAARSDSPDALKHAQARIRRNIETPSKHLERRMKAHLPVAPSPAIVAGMPAEQRDRVFDFMAYFHAIVRDADMMRNKAVRTETGADGVEREVLSNPMLMDNAIRRRLQIMDTYLNSMEQLYNLEKLQELYQLVIDEVGKADAGVQQAILVRLRELNNRRGLTMGARL